MTTSFRGVWRSSNALFIMLAVVQAKLCPKHCECVDSLTWRYNCANDKVIVKELEVGKLGASGQVICQDENIKCSDLPQIDFQVSFLKLWNCSSSILRCVSDLHALNQPQIQEISLSNLQGPLHSEDMQDLTYLKTLHLYQDKDTFISTDVINTLKHIKHLHISGGKMQFSSNMLNHTSLRVLDLEFSGISLFHEDIYDAKRSLPKLGLTNTKAHNNITELKDPPKSLLLHSNNIIEDGAFLGISELRKLRIYFYPLRSLSNQLLSPLKALQEVDITCPDDAYLTLSEFKLGSHTFANLPELQSVKITHCYIRTIPETLFEGSTALTSISIDENSKNYLHLKLFRNLFPVQHQNMLTIAPGGLFTNLTSLKTLTLTYNNIGRLPKEIFCGLRAMESLDLSLNSITELHKTIFKDLTSLKTLDLSGNNIKALYDGTFSNLGNLDVLDLSDNAIEELTVNVLTGLERLSRLYLRHNQIMRIEADSYTTFKFVPRLQYLDMSRNMLYILCEDCLQYDIPLIQTMNFSSNCFQGIWPFENNFLTHQVVIDLSDNKVSTVKLDLQANVSDVKLAPNKTIILDGNPIYCDCVNYGLFLRAKGNELLAEPRYILNQTRCSGPPHLKGHLMQNLSPSDLACELKYCPKNCSCVFRPATQGVIMDCHETPQVFIDPAKIHKSLYIYFNYFRNVTRTLILHHQPVTIEDLIIDTLNLSNTRLDNITFGPNDSLKVLDVSHNNLSTIPDAFLQTNITLYLSNNPLKCDCSLVKELKDYRVADFELVTCVGGEKLSQINVERLCAWNTYLMGFICMGIMVGIFVIKFTISVQRDFKRNWRYITRRLYGRESELPIDLMRRVDAAKQFDLFVSFAHQDSQFVSDNLLPRLENEFGQKVCVHHRDWIAGELITDQIVQSVENARRTVIILTEHFITSEWAYLEFRTAHNMSIREGRPRVIMILLKEDIVNDARLDTDIRSYITINTYLVWGDPDFWRKLKQVLPKRRRQ